MVTLQKTRWIVFRTVRTEQGEGPVPTVIEESEKFAMDYVTEASRMPGGRGGWYIQPCISNERQVHRVYPGQLDVHVQTPTA